MKTLIFYVCIVRTGDLFGPGNRKFYSALSWLRNWNYQLPEVHCSTAMIADKFTDQEDKDTYCHVCSIPARVMKFHENIWFLIDWHFLSVLSFSGKSMISNYYTYLVRSHFKELCLFPFSQHTVCTFIMYHDERRERNITFAYLQEEGVTMVYKTEFRHEITYQYTPYTPCLCFMLVWVTWVSCLSLLMEKFFVPKEKLRWPRPHEE